MLESLRTRTLLESTQLALKVSSTRDDVLSFDKDVLSTDLLFPLQKESNARQQIESMMKRSELRAQHAEDGRTERVKAEHDFSTHPRHRQTHELNMY